MGPQPENRLPIFLEMSFMGPQPENRLPPQRHQEPGRGGHGLHPSGGPWTRSDPTLMQLLPSTSSPPAVQADPRFHQRWPNTGLLEAAHATYPPTYPAFSPRPLYPFPLSFVPAPILPSPPFGRPNL